MLSHVMTNHIILIESNFISVSFIRFSHKPVPNIGERLKNNQSVWRSKKKQHNAHTPGTSQMQSAVCMSNKETNYCTGYIHRTGLCIMPKDY